MKQKQFEIPGNTLFRIAILVALTIAYLCSGCETSKMVNQVKSDTASVQRSGLSTAQDTEAGTARKEETASRDENEWMRLTLQYMASQHGGDTTINHFITQPSTIIYETGRSRHEEEKKTSDSSWLIAAMKSMAMSYDSLSHKLENVEKYKHSETKGLGLTAVLLAAAGLIIVNQAFRFITRKHSITTPKQIV